MVESFDEIYRRLLQERNLYPPSQSLYSPRGMSAPANFYGDPEYMAMLMMRMRWKPGDKISFTTLAVLKTDDRVAVVVVNNGQDAVVLSDEIGIFPSDKTITQLLLLEK